MKIIMSFIITVFAILAGQWLFDQKNHDLTWIVCFVFVVWLCVIIEILKTKPSIRKNEKWLN